MQILFQLLSLAAMENQVIRNWIQRCQPTIFMMASWVVPNELFRDSLWTVCCFCACVCEENRELEQSQLWNKTPMARDQRESIS